MLPLSDENVIAAWDSFWLARSRLDLIKNYNEESVTGRQSHRAALDKVRYYLYIKPMGQWEVNKGCILKTSGDSHLLICLPWFPVAPHSLKHLLLAPFEKRYSCLISWITKKQTLIYILHPLSQTLRGPHKMKRSGSHLKSCGWAVCYLLLSLQTSFPKWLTASGFF